MQPPPCLVLRRFHRPLRRPQTREPSLPTLPPRRPPIRFPVWTRPVNGIPPHVAFCVLLSRSGVSSGFLHTNVSPFGPSGRVTLHRVGGPHLVSQPSARGYWVAPASRPLRLCCCERSCSHLCLGAAFSPAWDSRTSGVAASVADHLAKASVAVGRVTRTFR